MNLDIQKSFHEAVGNNDIETARRMIAAGADVNAPYDENENRSFLDACYSGNLDMVKMLVEAGADVNLSDAYGTVPLVRAIVSIHDTNDVVKYLIDCDADVNGKDGSMFLPLHAAVSENDIKIAAQLMDVGANPNVVDDEGKNTLFCAIEHGNERMIQLLLSHGADVNHEDDEGYTPLSWTCVNGNDEICRLLLECGAKIDGVYSVLGNTVLMDAIQGGNQNCVKLILNQDVDVNEENIEFDTALSMAVFDDMSVDIIERLLDAGANPNVELAWGRTPLTLSVRERNVNTMHLLLRHGACFNDDSEYYSDFVLRYANDSLLNKSLTSKGYTIRTDDEAIILYVKYACSYLLRKALEAGANPNAVDAAGKSALSWALEHPRYPQGCAARLIRNGAAFAPELLLYAVRKRRRELVTAILETGADANVQDEQGNTALHYAARMNADFLVEDLLAHGADMNVKNAKGYTPLLLAIRYRCYRAASALLKHGADTTVCGGKHNESVEEMCKRYHRRIDNNSFIKVPFTSKESSIN